MEVTTPFSTRVGMDHVRPSSQGSGTITHMKHVNEEESKEKLVGGLEHHFFFVPYGNFIIPTDEIIFLVAQAPTSIIYMEHLQLQIGV